MSLVGKGRSDDNTPDDVTPPATNPLIAATRYWLNKISSTTYLLYFTAILTRHSALPCLPYEPPL